MAKRKSKIKPGIVADLPNNLEFQQFADFTRDLMRVPKAEIDRRVEEERLRRQES